MTIARTWLALVILASALPASAQSISWIEPVQGTSRYDARIGCTYMATASNRGLVVAPNGDAIVAGCRSRGASSKLDALTVRYDGTTGAVLWAAPWDDVFEQRDVLSVVALDPAGDVVVAGLAESLTSSVFSPLFEITVIKYRGATGERLWVRALSPTGAPNALSIAASAAGDVFVTGVEGTDWRTAKIAGATGALAWSVAVAGSSPLSAEGHTIVVDAAGNAYVTGTFDASVARTIKYDGSNGGELWSHSMAAPSQAIDMALGAGGGLFVLSRNASGPSVNVQRLDATTGTASWTASIPGGLLDSAAMTLDAAGHVILGGTIPSFATHAVKLDGSSGAVLWAASSTDPVCIASSAATDASGAVVVAGTSSPAGGLCAHKFSSAGAHEWSYESGSGVQPATGQRTAVKALADGRFLVAGTINGTGGRILETRLVRLDGGTGVASLFATDPPVPENTIAAWRGLSKPRNGRIAAVSTFAGTGGSKLRLSLHDTSDGHEIWTVDHDAFAPDIVAPTLAIDSQGRVAVAYSGSAGPFTALHAASDGVPLWSVPGIDPDVPRALMIDANDNIITSWRNCPLPDGNLQPPCQQHWRVVKLDASGQLLWSQVQGGPNGALLALDAQQNVVASGTSTGRTVKYSAGGGAPLWDHASTMPSGYDTFPATDAQGNVFLATVDALSASQTSVRLEKLDGATGQSAWIANVAANNADRFNPLSITTDPSGDPVVAFFGTPFSGAAQRNWTTSKRSGIDGAERWTRTYDLPPASLADMGVDASGNVVLAGDLHAVKYHGPSGFPLWHLATPSFARAMTVEPSGAAYVSASAKDPLGVYEALVLKITGGRIGPPAFAISDVNADGKGDLLWHHADGRNAVYVMNGLAPASTAEISGPGAGWTIQRVADFDNDGRSDIIWGHADGRIALHLMNGATTVASSILLGPGGWSVTHAPDLNGDGKADLVFQHADGTTAAWTMNGVTMSTGATLMGPGSGWSVIKTADFNGDGKHDLLWRHTDGRHAIWLMNGVTVIATAQILDAGGWTAAQVADLNGDGKADIVWQHADGTIAAWLMNGTAVANGATLLAAGSGWSVVKVADFDGDGRSDLLFQHSDGRAAIYLMNGLVPATTTQILNAGAGWSAILLTDLDGDSKADIVWQHTDGRVAVWLMNGTATASGSEILGPGTGWSVTGP